jgi:hypothetical protein
MSSKVKSIVSSFVAVVLASLLCLGCGGGKEPGVTTIVVGELSDFTGLSATALITIHKVIEDSVRYYNEEGLIPGVKIRLVSYDTKTDASRFISGWEWVKGRGAKVVVVCLPLAALTLKPFAEREKIAIMSLGNMKELVEPPGWAFSGDSDPGDEITAELKWMSEEYWDYTKGIPKIGYVGWDYEQEREIADSMRDYCQAHPDKFVWGGSYLIPLGGTNWGGPVEKTKDCDYVYGPTASVGVGTLLETFQNKGYPTKLIGTGCQAGMVGFMVKLFGWEFLDGWLTTSICLWWNQPSPVVDFVKGILDRYRPGEAEDIMREGTGYLGVSNDIRTTLQILAAAAEQVGAENFDGQAFYNAALNYKTNWEGYPQWSFSETERILVKDAQVYEWSAEAQDLVRMSDWLPFATE